MAAQLYSLCRMQNQTDRRNTPSPSAQSKLVPNSSVFELKSLKAILPLFDWIFFALGLYAAILIVLFPTSKNFAMMLGIDLLASMILVPLNEYVFQKKYPESKRFLNHDPIDKIANLPAEEKLVFFEQLTKFPFQRSIAFILGSFFKSLPAILYICFFWDHPAGPATQFILLVLLTLLLYVYGAAASFINSHIYLSDLVKKVHDIEDWSSVFERFEIRKYRYDFNRYEKITFILFVIFFTLVLGSIVWYSESVNFQKLVVQVLFVSTLSFLLLGRLLQLSRQFLLGGIESLFQTMNQLDYKKMTKLIPLHSTELLAKFEQSFNHLIQRLKKSEQELANWLVIESEKSRFSSLGEMAALVAHDLKGPFSVIRFCIEQIRENPDRLNSKEYVEQLETNLNHANELVNSLQSRFKDDSSLSSISFFEAYQKVSRILSTQFRGTQFKNITFEFDDPLHDIQIQMKSIHLIHVLENILRNSASHLMSIKKGSPRIDLFLKAQSENCYIVGIQDNGSGLTLEQFEGLTSYSFANKDSPNFSGLGLKLTKRLLESVGGNLSLEAVSEGSLFLLELPKGEAPGASSI